MSAQHPGFVALIPVKSPSVGKSRLTGVQDRAAIARAVAVDTIAAALSAVSVRRVVVITDEDFHAVADALGTTVLADAGDGLNAALRAGAALARSRWPELQPVALLADLPALTGPVLDDGLAAALAQGSGRPAYCRDAEGTGSTLYTATYADFEPRFGDGSSAAHAQGGAVAILGDLLGLRADVDDLRDLVAVRAIGVGPATAEVLART